MAKEKAEPERFHRCDSDVSALEELTGRGEESKGGPWENIRRSDPFWVAGMRFSSSHLEVVKAMSDV